MKSPLKRRGAVINGSLAVLLVIGVGFAYLSLADDGGGTRTATRTGRVTRGTVTATVSATGSVADGRTGSLSFSTSGTVTKIYVKPGSKVSKGDVLATVDQTDALENLRSAKAKLAVAADAGTSTAQKYSDYVSAQNSYNSAVRQLDGTVLKAPYAGTVTAVNGSVGESSSAGGGSSSSTSSSGSGSGSSGASGAGGTSGGSSSGASSGSSGSGFIELADLSKVQVQGMFTEADTTKIKLGQAAAISFEALSGVTATGKVTSIDPSSTTSNNVVQYGVTVSLDHRPSAVRIGQTATVTITTATATGVLYVPTAAVTTAGGISTVRVLQNGAPVSKVVQIGVKGDDGTEIKSGLNEGDQVVLSGSTSTSGTTGGGFPGGGGLPGGGGGLPGGGGFGGSGGGGRQ